MGLRLPKAPKVPKLDPALLKKIPDIVNNVAIKIIEGTPPGEAVESEIKDQIKEAVMREIEPMLGGNKMVVKLANKAVEKAIDKMWGKIKKMLKKKLSGEEISEPAPVTYQETPQYQQQTSYEPTPSKKARNPISAYGSFSLILVFVIVSAIILVIVFQYFIIYYTLALIGLLGLIGFIYAIIGIVKDKSKAMGIIGLIFTIALFGTILYFVVSMGLLEFIN